MASDTDANPPDPKNAPTAEQRLWRALRGRRLNDRKFRRGHVIETDAGTAGVDFACIEAAVAIDLVGPETPKLTAEKGRVMKAARVKLLRIAEADVLANFERVLQEIWRATEQTVKRRPPT